MGLARTSDDRPESGIGFCSALIFNLSLVALAISAALLAAEYARPNLYAYDISDASLEQTRAAIDAAAAGLPPDGADRRTYWGGQVKAALDRDDLDAAKGYLLLAPQMLPATDGQALNLALSKPQAQNSKAHSADARLIEAAALMLPKDARDAWTEATAPADPVDDFLSNPLQSLMSMATDALTPDAPPPPDPFELEEGYAIADMAKRTLLGEAVDPFKMKLTGFAQYLPGSDAVASGDGAAVRKGAATVLGARAKKQLPAFVSDALAQALDEALPDEILRTNLMNAANTPASKNDALVFATGVKDAFHKTAKVEPSRRIVTLLRRLNAIAAASSPRSAAGMLQFAANENDLSRLQLAAQAGGLRTVALSQHLKADTLSLAKGVMIARGKLDAGKALVGVSILGAFSAFFLTLFQALGRFLEKRNRENLPFSDGFWPNT